MNLNLPFPIWINSTGFVTKLLDSRASERSPTAENYRSCRMPISFKNGIAAGLQAIEGYDKTRLKSGVFSSYWGPADCTKNYYEAVYSGARSGATPLDFQNTTLAVAMGQLTIEAKITCPFRTFCCSPSGYLVALLSVCVSELTGARDCSILAIASDETKDWLEDNLGASVYPIRHRITESAAVAMVLSRERTQEAELAILGSARTCECRLDETAIHSLGISSCVGDRKVACFILGENTDLVKKAMAPFQIEPDLHQLGEHVEAFTSGVFIPIIASVQHAQLSLGQSREIRYVTCTRCLDGTYQWVLLGRG